jgi:hypothetical protein
MIRKLIAAFAICSIPVAAGCFIDADDEGGGSGDDCATACTTDREDCVKTCNEDGDCVKTCDDDKADCVSACI